MEGVPGGAVQQGAAQGGLAGAGMARVGPSQNGRAEAQLQGATTVTTAGPGSNAHQRQHACTRNLLHSPLMLCAASLSLQAAVDLFPSAGISPLTAETHRQWMGSEPQRIKVTRPAWLVLPLA